MKHNHAIGLGVSAKKAEIPPPILVPKPYGMMLLRLGLEHGISEVELLRRAGYAVKKPGDRAISHLRNGKASMRVGVAVRKVLVDAGVDVPAIFVTNNDMLSRWAIIGDRMRMLSHSYFMEQMERLDEWVAVATRLREIQREAGDPPLDLRIAMKRQGLSSVDESNDSPTEYRRRPNGRHDEEAVGPPRTSTPRSRRRHV